MYAFVLQVFIYRRTQIDADEEKPTQTQRFAQTRHIGKLIVARACCRFVRASRRRLCRKWVCRGIRFLAPSPYLAARRAAFPSPTYGCTDISTRNPMIGYAARFDDCQHDGVSLKHAPLPLSAASFPVIPKTARAYWRSATELLARCGKALLGRHRLERGVCKALVPPFFCAASRLS